MTTTKWADLLIRRDFLRASALGLTAIPLLAACDGTEDAESPMDAGASPDSGTFADAQAQADSGAQAQADSGAQAQADSGAQVDSGSQTDSGTDQDGGVPAEGWATGGTAAMVAKASYPDPFTSAAAVCAVVAQTTEGPCTTSTELVREDVSEGWAGLPVRLALRVVDSACAPIAGATVKIWHTNVEGSYSGATPNNNMCLIDSGYASSDFFRGAQTTDAEGRVFFDTCYPGWYRGRAVHIHFQVTSGGSTYKVSQLFFPESITEEVFGSHPDYSGYGQPDTVFSNDNIMAGIPSGERDRLIFDVQRMTDGAMLAAKTVTVTN